MSQHARFYRALSVLAGRVATGDRQAELALDRLYCLFRNVRNAVQAGDAEWVRELTREAEARGLLRDALDRD